MSGYIGTQPVPQATQTRDSFTCTAGQTSFATSGYTPNFLDVYLNGVKLTAQTTQQANGSDVVLASGAATGDVLEVVAFTTFEAGASGGGFYKGDRGAVGLSMVQETSSVSTSRPSTQTQPLTQTRTQVQLARWL